jgi:hypothetical protein
MDGTLKFFENKWFVKSLSENNDKLYPIWEESQEWIDKESTAKFIKEGIEVVYDVITTGEYSVEKQQIIKTDFAKIKAIYFESL